jgi:hypothetical protein
MNSSGTGNKQAGFGLLIFSISLAMVTREEIHPDYLNQPAGDEPLAGII